MQGQINTRRHYHQHQLPNHCLLKLQFRNSKIIFCPMKFLTQRPTNITTENAQGRTIHADKKTGYNPNNAVIFHTTHPSPSASMRRGHKLPSSVSAIYRGPGMATLHLIQRSPRCAPLGGVQGEIRIHGGNEGRSRGTWTLLCIS